MLRQVCYNPRTYTATIQEDGDDLPSGSVAIGSYDTDDVESDQQAVRDLLYKRSETNPAEEADFPDNITNPDITIVKKLGVVEDLALAELELDDGADGEDYTFYLPVSGGVPPYIFSLDTPPTGCTVDEDTGLVTFDAPAADDYEIDAVVTDAAENEATQTYALTVV